MDNVQVAWLEFFYHEGVSTQRIIIVPRMQLSSSSQRRSLTLEVPDQSLVKGVVNIRQPWAETAGDIRRPLRKPLEFVSRFVAHAILKRTERWSRVLSSTQKLQSSEQEM